MNTVDPIKSKEEIDKLKRYFKKQNPRDYLLFTLGINSALRISDLLSLQVNHVKKKDGSYKERIYIREGKTNKEKKYKLSPGAKEGLDYYFNNINPKKYFGHNEIKQSDYLFASQRGPHNPVNRTWAWKKLDSASKELNISGNIGCHSLRKTFGYMARTEFDAPIELIQAKLNHSSPAVTRRYIGLEQEEVENLEEKVSL